MRACSLLVTAALALSAAAANAQTVQTRVAAQRGAIGAAELVEVTATIQSIDLETREVVLRTAEGNNLAITAGPEVKRLAELRVGDEVEIQYYESLTLELSKVEGGTASRSEVSTETRAEPSELPGGVKTKQTVLTAKITAVDREGSTVTLVGPKGRSVELEVDPEIVKNLAVGDLVSAVYTEALAVSVSRAAAKP